MAAWRYEFYFRVAKTIFYSLAAPVSKILFCHSKIKFISSRRRVISSIYFTFIPFHWVLFLHINTPASCANDTYSTSPVCLFMIKLHTIPYNFIIRNCMEPSRRLFFISLGAADFVPYDHREVFFPTTFCQENVIMWKQIRHDRFGRPKPAKIKGFSSSISEVSFVSIWIRRIHFILHVVVISGTDLGSSLP